MYLRFLMIFDVWPNRLWTHIKGQPKISLDRKFCEICKEGQLLGDRKRQPTLGSKTSRNKIHYKRIVKALLVRGLPFIFRD